MMVEEIATLPESDLRPCCWRCGRVFAELLSRPWHIRCRDCKAENRYRPGDAAAPSKERPLQRA